MGAFAEKPCDCPNTDNGESLRGRIEECARMRPYEEPPMGVGDAVAIVVSRRDGMGASLYMGTSSYGLLAHTKERSLRADS
jgi:hypothetical protein